MLANIRSHISLTTMIKSEEDALENISFMHKITLIFMPLVRSIHFWMKLAIQIWLTTQVLLQLSESISRFIFTKQYFRQATSHINTII